MRRAPCPPPSLPRSLAGGRAGHKGRPACPEPRHARASAPPLAAQPPRNGRGLGGGGVSASGAARPGSDLPPPGGRAGNPQGPPAPLCDMCCRPGLHERGGYLAGSRVPVRFSLDKLARRGENWRAQQGSWFLGDQREENEQRATRITAVGETTLYPGVQPRGPDWGRGGED